MWVRPGRASTLGLRCAALVFITSACGLNAHSQDSAGEELFPPLEGQYPVGVIDDCWVDAARPETYTSDPEDRRHLFVRIWYPAKDVENAHRAPYLPDLAEFEDPSLFEAHTSKLSRSYASVGLAEGGPFPVLLYSHGGGWTRFSGSFETEALASAGYVVVAMDHTGFNKSTKFPDGYTFVNDALPPPEATNDLRASALASWRYLGESVAPIWHRDATFVLDRLEGMNDDADAFLHGALDMERVGMFGWSFGGSLAIQMAKDDPRIKAAVDQDGQLFGDVRDSGTDRPIMMMHSPADSVNPDMNPVLDELIDMVERWNETLLKKSTGDWYDLTITKVQHGHFSDLSLFYPMPAEQLKPARAHRIVLDFTKAFFDTYLRGESAALLDGNTDGYPEVTLRRRSVNESD